MATQANAATAKAATNTRSTASILRADAPKIRTSGAIIEKHEQIQDALEHQTITGKVAEQMNQTLKGILGVAKLEMQYWSLMLKFKRNPPVPRSPILRSVIGLAPDVSAKDAESVRALMPPEK